MAKRLSAERPYTPLDDTLLASVLSPAKSPSPALPVGETSVEGSYAEPHVEMAGEPFTAADVGTSLQKGPQSEAVLPTPAYARRVREAWHRQRPEPAQTATTQFTGADESERMSATLRLKVARRDKREFEAFTARLGAALETTLKPSNLLRAMLSVLQNAEPALSDLARRQAPLRRPPNDDAIAYADFEHRLVCAIDAAVRLSAPLK